MADRTDTCWSGCPPWSHSHSTAYEPKATAPVADTLEELMTDEAPSVIRGLDTDTTWEDAHLIVRAVNAHDELVAALEKVVALAQWMSGADDFSPEGKALVGWVKQRPDLFDAMSLLARIKGESNE